MAAAAGLLLVLAVCSRNPVEPALPALEVVVAGGDGQYGTEGVELPQPLRVVVRVVETKLPASEVDVIWEVVSGDASIVGPDVQVTAEDGSAEISLRLGTSVGEVSVAARVASQAGAGATLRSFLVGTPVLTSVQPTDVAAGGVIVLEGENFSPVPEQNAVLFSGIRGRVSSATATRLEVEVPDCLPPRGAFGVRTSLGTVSSDSLTISVSSDAPPVAMAVGEYQDLDDPAGLACVRLPGADGAVYLATTYSSGTVAGARHTFHLTGLAYSPTGTAPVRATSDLLASPSESLERSTPSAQEIFEHELRLEEERLIEARSGSYRPLSEALAAPAAVPSVGQTRNFFVFNGATDPDERFDEITASVRFVGEEVAIYVDVDAPEPGFTDADLESLAARFDEVIHPTVTGTFGRTSDLDRSERVAVLFTPVVNRLTARESDSFVGGFFFGRDLLPELSSSNAAEVFYALVPDPEAEHGDERSRDQVLSVVPAILAHEFQHMVHFNERVLVRGASQDALWLLEGLAQMAEELVARVYDRTPESSEAELFRDGNRRRARLFLQRPDTVSLIVSSGRGTLGERGAGFLFLLYLHEQVGGDVLGRLTGSTRTGVSNVEQETGATWPVLLPDWAAATYIDGVEGASGPFVYPNVDLAEFLGHPPPYHDPTFGGSDFGGSATLLSSTQRYFRLAPPDGGSLSVGFGGPGGGDYAPGAALGLRLVRIR
ncbi:MAG: hypothetical protein WD995_03375 [Gemmatimonadota bacterium]